MQLSAQTVRLGATPRNKSEAIELAGIALVDAGYIERAYIESMMGRELQANTCLGRGIAIPHGMAPDRHLIKRTGVAVVQMPMGVAWNADERVGLVVAIAAKSDEHLEILSSLMDVLDDEELIERLSHTTNVEDILEALNGEKSLEGHIGIETPGGFEGQCIEAIMGAPAGLHARPATRLVEVAGGFDSQIFVEYKNQRASALSLVSLLKLGVVGGESVRLLASGTDAALALTTLKTAIESGLGDDLNEVSESGAGQQPLFSPVSDGPFLSGIKASPGIAIASLHVWREITLAVEDRFSDTAFELEQLKSACRAAQSELEKLVASLREQGNQQDAGIFAAHSAILHDPELRGDTEKLIQGGHGAAWAWNTVVAAKVAELEASSNTHLAQRSTDFTDVGNRVLRHLGVQVEQGSELPLHPVILVARDLTPSQTAELDPQRVRGLCMAEGGPTSHTAILARSLGLPAVVGLGEEVLHVAGSDSPCILDGAAGRLYTGPSAADLEAARSFQLQLTGQQNQEYKERFRPALMKDGHRVEVVANIGEASEAARAVESGAEGVGLLRTEILFLGRDCAPAEQEQFESLEQITTQLAGLPLVVRTLDIGGDKAVDYLDLPREENPFLGVRGARLTLRYPELFKTQLRAIFRASELGPIRIMFPMIGTVEDWRAVRNFAEGVRQEMEALEVEYGVMIEVPSAALMARELAREVDFFSIGTNDLTQYTLAIDRLHPQLGKDSDPLHPAVLRLIAMTVEAATEAGKWVGVCGSAADEVQGALILTGLGVTELSMSIPSIPAIKAALRHSSLESVHSLAKRALACSTAAQVRSLGCGL